MLWEILEAQTSSVLPRFLPRGGLQESRSQAVGLHPGYFGLSERIQVQISGWRGPPIQSKKSQLIQGTSRGKVFPTHCGRSLCCGLCPFLFVQVSVEPQTGQVQTAATGTMKNQRAQATAKLSSLELRLAVACALFCCRQCR